MAVAAEVAEASSFGMASGVAEWQAARGSSRHKNPRASTLGLVKEPTLPKMFGKCQQEKATYEQPFAWGCKRCDVVWESDFHNDYCCSACRRGQGHTGRCWKRRVKPGSFRLHPLSRQEQPSNSSGHHKEECCTAVVSEAKAEVRRATHSLLNDSDFASCFTSHGEPAEPIIEEEKEGKGTKRKAKSQGDNPAESPRKKRAVGKPKKEASSKARSAVDNTKGSEGKAKFIPVLLDIMTRAGATRHPQATKAPMSSKAAWQKALQRRAVGRADQSEEETLTGVQRTWEELVSFAQRDNRQEYITELGVAEMDKEERAMVMLESFLYESKAQARAMAALRWMKNNLYLKWPIQELTQPAKSKYLQPSSTTTLKHYNSQATCAEPVMIAKLEEAIEEMQEQGNPRWLGLLSQWLQAVGGLRLKYIKKSTPRKLTNSTFHAWCQRGEQKSNQGGFEWSVPANFISKPTCNWAEKFLDEWEKVPADKRNEMGMVFDTEKSVPIKNRACINMARTAMGPLVANERGVSKRWKQTRWKQTMPTLGLAANFSELEMRALRSWQDKSPGGKEVDDTRRRKGWSYQGDARQVQRAGYQSDANHDHFGRQRVPELPSPAEVTRIINRNRSRAPGRSSATGTRGSEDDDPAKGMHAEVAIEEELSRKIKHEAAIILESIMCFNVWEETPESAYRRARQDLGNQSKLDKVLAEDAVVCWERAFPLGEWQPGAT